MHTIKFQKMKTKEFNLNQMNLVPLTSEELVNENGGGLLEWAIKLVAEKFVEKVVDYAWDHRAEVGNAWQAGVKANQAAGTGSWVPVGAGF